MSELQRSSGAGAYDWTMGLSFGGLEVEYRWRELFHEGRSMGHWGELVALATGETLRRSSAKDWIADALMASVAHFRRAELRASFDVNSTEFVLDKEHRKKLILEIFERASRGEFMGQLSNNGNLYVQDIAGIFDQDLSTVLTLVDELIDEGRIGIYGMVLIPAEAYEESFRYWRNATGHRRLTMGDFGNWGCSECGHWGDEHDNPRDYPCEPQSVSEQLAAAGGAVVDLSESGQVELDPQKIAPSDEEQIELESGENRD